MADVFISYSRQDTDFVRVLHAALCQSDYDAWIDWEDIAPTTAWWQEIEAGIEAAHTFIFVISQASLHSVYCRREIDHAINHGKRLLPVLRRKDFAPGDMHPELGQHQWVPFQEGDNFEVAFATLVETINTDIDHKKAHTRLEVRAIEWRQNGGEPSLLLRGKDLQKADIWLLQAAGKTPSPTELQGKYIAASRQASSNRQKAIIGGLLALLAITGGLATLAYSQYRSARRALAGQTEATQQAERLLEESLAAKSREANQRRIAEEKTRQAINALQSARKARSAEAKQRQQAQAALKRAEVGEAKANRQARIAKEQTEIAQANEAKARTATEKAETESRKAQKLTLEAEIQAQALTVENLIASRLYMQSLLRGLEAGRQIQRIESQLGAAMGARSSQALDANPGPLAQGTRLRAVSALREIYHHSSLERNILSGHEDIVWSVSTSPDGAYLASASGDGVVKLWNRQGHPVQSWQGHKTNIRAVAFAPDSQILATASDDGTVKLWNHFGKEHLSFNGHSGSVFSVAFSPDGETLASASLDQTIRVWTIGGQEIRRFDGHRDGIYGVAFSPDGQSLASASADGTVGLWDIGQSQPPTFIHHGAPVHSLSFAPRQALLAIAGEGGGIRIWNPLQKTEVASLAGHTASINSLTFAPSGQTLASADEDGVIKLWQSDHDGQTWHLRASLQGTFSSINSLHFTPDGQTLIAATDDGTIKLWTLDSRQLPTIEDQLFDIVSIDFAPDRGGISRFKPSVLASGSANGTISIWDQNGRRLNSWKAHDSVIWSVKHSPDGRFLASGGGDGQIKLWNHQGELQKTFTGHSSRSVLSISFAENGQTLASAGDDGTVRLWNTNGPSSSIPITSDASSIYSVSFAPRSAPLPKQGLIFAEENGSVKLWDGANLQTISSSEGGINVSFAPDGQALAVAKADGTVHLWNLHTQEIQTLEGHSNRVFDVSFSPDGQILASASADKTIKLWDSRGLELQTLEGHQDNVLSVSFSADGQTLASLDGSGRVIFWSFNLDELMFKGCAWLQDYLNNPTTPQVEKDLCKDILPSSRLSASFNQINWVISLRHFIEGLFQKDPVEM